MGQPAGCRLLAVTQARPRRRGWCYAAMRRLVFALVSAARCLTRPPDNLDTRPGPATARSIPGRPHCQRTVYREYSTIWRFCKLGRGAGWARLCLINAFRRNRRSWPVMTRLAQHHVPACVAIGKLGLEGPRIDGRLELSDTLLRFMYQTEKERGENPFEKGLFSPPPLSQNFREMPSARGRRAFPTEVLGGGAGETFFPRRFPHFH